MSVELRRRIAEELEVELPATLLFDYPTLGKMRARVVEVAAGGLEDGEEDEEEGEGTRGGQVAWDEARTAGGEVVVSGTACRFGQGWTVGELWQALERGEDGVLEWQ